VFSATRTRAVLPEVRKETVTSYFSTALFTLPIALLDDVPRDCPVIAGRRGTTSFISGSYGLETAHLSPPCAFLSYLISAIPSRGGLNLSWAQESGNAGAKVQTASEESGSTAVNSKTV
jgi:hypothetical protein